MAARRLAWAMAAVVAMTGAALALVTFQRYPPGEPKQVPDAWPKGCAALVNFEGRVLGLEVAGPWTQVSHSFYFRGDTKAFNRFLAAYGDLKTAPLPLTLTIHAGKPRFGAFRPQDVPKSYGWSFSIEREGGVRGARVPVVVRLDVWLHGDVDLADMAVPVNVQVKSGGEIERFAEKHNRRARERQAEHDQEPAAPIAPPR